MDNKGISPIFGILLWPGLASMIAALYIYETTYTPLISAENAPTLAGIGIDYLWVIAIIIVAITAFIWVAFGRAKKRTA